jgi:short subunit dehydrogenase-like uncharacterized protein
MAAERSYDIVLYGATGYTGGLIAHHLGERLAGRGLRWALAGRSRAKLEARRAELKAGAAEPGLIEADTEDRDSLRAMASQARVVMTTVGPYTRYGEPMIEACIDAKTDYIDLTGEPAWWQEMIERHHERAGERGVLLVPACGFDSIPADLGARFTAAQLPTDGPMTIDAYMTARASASGSALASALEVIRGLRLADLRREPIRRVDELGLWAMPAPLLDPLVVERSSSLCPDAYGQPLTYRQYLGFRSPVVLAAALAGAGLLFGAVKLGLADVLLAKLRPPGRGPTERTRAKSWFRFDFIGRAGEREVRAHISGGDPGYEETAKMMSEAAIMLVETRAEVGLRGGILTPAAVFGLGLVDRLRAAGIEIEQDA